jgi:hypothetical protein
MEKQWIRKSGDTRRKIVGKFRDMFVPDIEANSGQVSGFTGIKEAIGAQEQVANFKEGNDQRKPSIELSDRDKRVKKICERLFWGNFVFLFFVAMSPPGIININLSGTIFLIDIVTLQILFIGYWKFIRKQPIPNWFKKAGDFNWNYGNGSSNFRFTTDYPRSNPFGNHIFHGSTSSSGTYAESNAHRYFIQNTSHNYSHNRRNHK